MSSGLQKNDERNLLDQLHTDTHTIRLGTAPRFAIHVVLSAPCQRWLGICRWRCLPHPSEKNGSWARGRSFALYSMMTARQHSHTEVWGPTKRGAGAANMGKRTLTTGQVCDMYMFKYAMFVQFHVHSNHIYTYIHIHNLHMCPIFTCGSR